MQQHEINLMNVVNYLILQWKLILVSTLAFTLISLPVSFISEDKYEIRGQIIPHSPEISFAAISSFVSQSWSTNPKFAAPTHNPTLKMSIDEHYVGIEGECSHDDCKNLVPRLQKFLQNLNREMALLLIAHGESMFESYRSVTSEMVLHQKTLSPQPQSNYTLNGALQERLMAVRTMLTTLKETKTVGIVSMETIRLPSPALLIFIVFTCCGFSFGCFAALVKLANGNEK